MANDNRCIQEHYCKEQYNGKHCPYDNLNSKFDNNSDDYEAQNHLRYLHVKDVGAKYNLTNHEINAIYKYVNSFNDKWYVKLNK